MRICIVNSGAPGRAPLLAPFFDALIQHPGVELLVLEQVPKGERPSSLKAASLSSPSGNKATIEPIITHFFRRRHACVQIMSSRFCRALSDFHPEVIYILGEAGYTSTYQTVRFVRQELPAAKICVFSAQNIYQRFPFPFPRIESYVLKRIDHAFPLGKEHEAVLRRKGYHGPATCLPLGVDTQRFTPEGSLTDDLPDLPRPIAGYIGDFLPARDVPLLIAAASLCRFPLGILAVGDGAGRADAERLVKQKGLMRKIHFTGAVPHARIPAYLRQMDLLVLPSRAIWNRCFGIFRIANAEQFGRVLVEAMACGKPVIGSSCGEIPTVIGNAGLVYQEGNVNELTSALERLAGDENLRLDLGRKALARAREVYDWRVIAGRFVKACESVLSPA